MSEEFDDLYTRLMASIDQVESLLKDSAPIFITYYKTLLKEGIPDELAQILVLDFHKIFWKKGWGVARD